MLLLPLLGIANTVLADDVTVGDVSNTECANRTRSESPEILKLTRTESGLVGELRDHRVNCAHHGDVIVMCQEDGQNLSIKIDENIPGGIIATCQCPINIYFTIFNALEDEYQLTVDGRNVGMVSFKEHAVIEINLWTLEQTYFDIHELVEWTMPTEPSFGPGQLTVNDFEATAADFELGTCYVLYNVGSQAYLGEGNAWGTQASITKETPLLVRFTMPEGMTLEENALLFNDYTNRQQEWMLEFVDIDLRMYGDCSYLRLGNVNTPNTYWQVLPADGEKTYHLQTSPRNSTYNPTSYPGFVGLDITDNKDNTALSPSLDEGDGHYIDWQFFAVPAWTQYFKEKDIYDKAQELKTFIRRAEAVGVDVSAVVTVYNDLNATLEQLQQALNDLRTAIISKMAEGTAEYPGDGTLLIKNPNFDNDSKDGWQGTDPNMVGANVAEVWNRTFNIYQVIDGLPDGVYALRANTAFRGSMEDMQNGIDATAVLYATTGDEEMLTAPFINVWSIHNTEQLAGETPWGIDAREQVDRDNVSGVFYYSPSNTSAARLYFEKGWYQNVLFFEVSGGKVHFGVKNTSICPDHCDNWAAFDNFTLAYYGQTKGAYQAWARQGVPTYTIPKDAIYTWTYADAYQESLSSEATNKAEALAAIEEVKTRKADLQKNILWWNYYINICSTLADHVNRCKTYHESFWDRDDIKKVTEYLEDTYQCNLFDRKLTTEQLIEEYYKVMQLESMFEVANREYRTSIKEFEIQIEPSPIFDLQGRRIFGKPEKGVYIQNGKKVKI